MSRERSVIREIVIGVIVTVLGGIILALVLKDSSGNGSGNPLPPPPQTTTINLAYAGDTFGCILQLSVRIGNQRVIPQGNFYRVDGVEPGRQTYEVSGQIGCQGIGTCQATGSGSINVIANNTYYVRWQNVGVGQCSVVLSDQQ